MVTFYAIIPHRIAHTLPITLKSLISLQTNPYIARNLAGHLCNQSKLLLNTLPIIRFTEDLKGTKRDILAFQAGNKGKEIGRRLGLVGLYACKVAVSLGYYLPY